MDHIKQEVQVTYISGLILGQSRSVQVVTLQRRLSLAWRKPRISPVYVLVQGGLMYSKKSIKIYRFTIPKKSFQKEYDYLVE